MYASAIQKTAMRFSECKPGAIAKWLKTDLAKHSSLPAYGQVPEDRHKLIRIGRVASAVNR
jgi:hypothetical protein